MQWALNAAPRLFNQLNQPGAPDRRALSVYLPTLPPRGAGEPYLLALRDHLKALRSQLPEDERPAFETCARRVERFLTDDFSPHHVTVAVFAFADESETLALPLPKLTASLAHWGDRPFIEPLVAALDAGERIAVALVDQAQARIYSIFLDEIEAQEEVNDEIPSKPAGGGWFSLAETHHVRHRDDAIVRHMKRTVTALRRALHERPFDRLLIGGTSDAVALLRRQFTPALRARFAGLIEPPMPATDADVLRAALGAAAEVERQQDMAAMAELFDSVSSRHAAIGLDDTLEAINTNRLHVLYVASEAALVGSECTSCGRLTSGASTCAVCGVPTVPTAILREHAIERTLNQGGHVEIVTGPAGERLAEFGGLGGWTRY